jgi:hypothetical protein
VASNDYGIEALASKTKLLQGQALIALETTTKFRLGFTHNSAYAFETVLFIRDRVQSIVYTCASNSPGKIGFSRRRSVATHEPPALCPAAVTAKTCAVKIFFTVSVYDATFETTKRSRRFMNLIHFHRAANVTRRSAAREQHEMGRLFVEPFCWVSPKSDALISTIATASQFRCRRNFPLAGSCVASTCAVQNLRDVVFVLLS